MSVLSIPPSALNLLFPEYFAETPRFGGYPSPCTGIKVKHDKLFNSIVASTIFYMEYHKVISIRPSKVGGIFKKDTLALIKLRNFDYRHYGYLSYKLARLPVNGWLYLYNIVAEKVEVDYPVKYMINRVAQYDLTPLRYLWYGGRPNCREIMKFKPQAEWLRSLLVVYSRSRPLYFNILEKEVKRALSSMVKEYEDYDYD